MRINEQLNLIEPIDRADGTTVYVHSTPVSRSVFEANFLLMSKTFTALHAEGLGMLSGPRVAALMLQQIGAQMARDGMDPAQSLLAEIRRLTNVVAPTPAGWEVVPFEDAVARKMLDDDDVAEVMGAVCFFTVGWHGYPRKTRMDMLEGAARLWGAEITSLNSTAYAAFLQTSTLAETSEKIASAMVSTNTSSVPS
jgi:hypothetical protein